MIDPGPFVLVAAVMCAATSAFAAALAARGQGLDHFHRARRLAWAAALFLGLGVVELLGAALARNVNYALVHEHTDAATSWPFRVAALWGGQDGTLLLWATAAAFAVVLQASTWSRVLGRSLADDSGHPLLWSTSVGAASVAVLAVAAFFLEPFRSTPIWTLELEPLGRGLQPSLQSPYMLIHPPLQFIAYGLAVLPFSAAIAHVITGRREWADLILPWVRLGFLVSWVGLVLGALWAYHVLTFGGFWAWDPVETGNLLAFLPWIPLIHGVLYYRKKGTYPVMAPVFALATVWMSLVSAFVTRSGWWVSVHAFTDPTQSFQADPLARLLAILDVSPPIRTVLALLVVSLVVPLIAWLWRMGRDAPGRRRWTGLAAAFAASAAAVAVVDVRLLLSLWFQAGLMLWPSNPTMAVVAILLLLAAFVASPLLWSRPAVDPTEKPFLERWVTIGQLVYVGMILVVIGFLVIVSVAFSTVNGYQRSQYDLRLAIVAVPFALALGAGLMNQTFGRTRTIAWGAAALVGGIALAVWRPGDWPAMVLLPVLVFALIGAFTKWFKVADPGPSGGARRRILGGLLLAGSLMAVVFWANRPSVLDFGDWWVPLAPYVSAYGFVMSVIVLFSALEHLKTGTRRSAVCGGLALAGSVAFGVAVPLGLGVALAARGVPNSHALTSRWRSLQREVRKGGTYLVHVALCLGLIGYTLSVAYASEVRVVSLGEFESVHALGHEFSFGAHSPIPSSDPPMLEAWWNVDSRPLTAVLWQERPYHYAERMDVLRLPLHDLQLRPVRFDYETASGNVSVEPHVDDTSVPEGSRLVAIHVEAQRFPAMHLVWGGAWGIALGLLLILSAGGFRFEAKAPTKD